MKGRRIVVPAQHEARVEAFDVPEPREGQVLVRVDYSLISPGTELGTYNQEGLNTPQYPGYTAVGTVLKAGGEPGRDLEGRTVFLFPCRGDSTGCHASHKLFDLHGLALPLPDGPAADKACFARMINVALTPYCNASKKSMGSVLVIGLGLVGNMAGQIGRIRGMRTIGIETDAERAERGRKAGIEHVIDPAAGDPVAAVKALTGGRGTDLTVNVTGLAAPFAMALQATADGGEISTLGGARDRDYTANLHDIFNTIHFRHLVVRGGWELQLPLRTSPACEAPSTEMNLANAFRWLQSGAIDLEPAWSHTIWPEEFKTAYDALNAKDPAYLGVVVNWKE